RLGLLRWLRARLAVSADGFLQLGNLPSSLHLGTHLFDGVMARPDLLPDLPIGLFRPRLEQFGDQVALLLGGQVPAADVLRDDVGERIINAQIGVAARWSGCKSMPF